MQVHFCLFQFKSHSIRVLLKYSFTNWQTKFTTFILDAILCVI